MTVRNKKTIEALKELVPFGMKIIVSFDEKLGHRVRTYDLNKIFFDANKEDTEASPKILDTPPPQDTEPKPIASVAPSEIASPIPPEIKPEPASVEEDYADDWDIFNVLSVGQPLYDRLTDEDRQLVMYVQQPLGVRANGYKRITKKQFAEIVARANETARRSDTFSGIPLPSEQTNAISQDQRCGQEPECQGSEVDQGGFGNHENGF